jgi:hypothetical protein
MSRESFANLKTLDVITACEKHIVIIDKHRKSLEEDLIESQMKARRGIFGILPPVKTREEALKILENESNGLYSYGFRLRMARCHDEYLRSSLEALLRLAKATQDSGFKTIAVSSGDFGLIQRYFDPKGTPKT